MLIIRHRVNTLEELEQTPTDLGVEIDVRGYGSELLLNHDPLDKPEKYTKLEDYLKNFHHRFIIFNIKDMGYESKIIQLAKDNGIEDYFLLDVEFPFVYQASRNKGFRKIAARFSEAEPIEFALAQKDYLDWIWIDTNTRFPMDKETYETIKAAGMKTCLVCPERWGRPRDIDNYVNYMKDNTINIDAVMTAMPYVEKWKQASKLLSF